MTTKSEIDYVEECDGWIPAYEFRWYERRKPKVPIAFKSTYQERAWRVISPMNYTDFLTESQR